MNWIPEHGLVLIRPTEDGWAIDTYNKDLKWTTGYPHYGTKEQAELATIEIERMWVKHCESGC